MSVVNVLEASCERIRVLILGSGPAGYTAAIYAARASLNPVLYEGIQPGGQLTTTTEIENFPGYPSGTTGNELMDDIKRQAVRFGTDVRLGVATSTDLSCSPFKVTIDNEKIICTDTLIIATGATAKYLGIESEEKYRGQGVSACATCDGFFYRGQDVAVIGGGDTACEEATYLSGICRKVYIIVRKPYLRASKPMQDRVFSTQNIEVLFECETKEIIGDSSGVCGIVVTHIKTGLEERRGVSGVFIAIGHQPNSEIFLPLLERDSVGYIKTAPGSSCTNIPGVFACGDVQDPYYRQAITAAASGCKAAIDVERYLSGTLAPHLFVDKNGVGNI